MSVVYFDQLWGAVRTQKLVKILFWAVFNLLDENQKQGKMFEKQCFSYTLKVHHSNWTRHCLVNGGILSTEKVEKVLKKLVKIHNT